MQNDLLEPWSTELEPVAAMSNVQPGDHALFYGTRVLVLEKDSDCPDHNCPVWNARATHKSNQMKLCDSVLKKVPG